MNCCFKCPSRIVLPESIVVAISDLTNARQY